jgi:hypothetical protein
LKKFRTLLINTFVYLGFTECGRPLTEEELNLCKEHKALPIEYKNGSIKPLTQQEIKEIEEYQSVLKLYNSLPESMRIALSSNKPLQGMTVICCDPASCMTKTTKLFVNQGARIDNAVDSKKADFRIYYRQPPLAEMRCLYVEYQGNYYELDGPSPNKERYELEALKLIETISVSRANELIKAN